MMLALASPAYAQAPYPDHGISLVVPYSAGGWVDSLARPVAEKLGQVLGQAFVTINRPGASGMIGAASVMRAKPDGYTLLAHSTAVMAARSAIADEKPDPNFPALAVAATIASTPGIMTVASALGVATFKELVDKLRAQPGKYAYGSSGVGSQSHLWSAYVVRKLGLDVQHVPFAGGSPALVEVMAGRIAWMFDTPQGAIKGIKTGKAIPLMVASSSRLRDFPNVPTAVELGLPQLADQLATLFIMAPAETRL